MIRSLKNLQRDQAEIMSSFRQEQTPPDSVALLPRPGGSTAISVFGRITQVISSDPDYGPHLMVKRQQWTGTPPTASDSSVPAVRCYPTPNHTVTDYLVDDYVLILTANGAMVAQRLL
ncbi:MAG: hypothetical protein JSV03_10195 [Planctomycetota bacterium]|nr:MAG: hypothetical protein JSV03_10195 [Planctomycetota bacterium]